MSANESKDQTTDLLPLGSFPGGPVSPNESTSRHAEPQAKDPEADDHELDANGAAVTTMMLRNIPKKYSSQALVKEVNAVGFAGTYNCFHLPTDERSKSNAGYAFINFKTSEGAAKFRLTFSGRPFQLYNSQKEKLAVVCAARVQGLENNAPYLGHAAVESAPLEAHASPHNSGNHAGSQYRRRGHAFCAAPSFPAAAPKVSLATASAWPAGGGKGVRFVVGTLFGPMALEVDETAPAAPRKQLLGAADKAAAYGHRSVGGDPAYIKSLAGGCDTIFGAGGEAPVACGLGLASAVDSVLSRGNPNY